MQRECKGSAQKIPRPGWAWGLRGLRHSQDTLVDSLRDGLEPDDLFLMPTAGWLADRYCKRRVIVACKVAEELREYQSRETQGIQLIRDDGSRLKEFIVPPGIFCGHAVPLVV